MAFEFDPTTARPADAAPQDQSKVFDQTTAREADGPLTRGFRKSGQAAKITSQLALQDSAGAAQTVKESDDYARANPGRPEGAKLMDAWNRGDGVMGGVSEVAGQIGDDYSNAKGFVPGVQAVGRDLRAMGEGVVEQVPNMIAPMAGMIAGGVAGAKGGAALGGAIGSVVPGAGTVGGAALGGTIGGVGGAWAGASAGNTLMEGGGTVQDALQKAGINPQDTAAVQAFLDANGNKLLGQSAIKGGIIGAVDTATAGLAHGVLTAPAKAAAERAFTAMGVDMADSAAVKAASQSDQFAKLIANDATYQAAQKGAGNVARNVTAAAMEPVGEGLGEYLGEGVGKDNWDTKNAALEAFSSLGQSGAMFAGQKAYQYATKPRSGEADVATPPGEDATFENTPPPAGPTLALPAPVYDVGPDGVIRTTEDNNAAVQAQRQAEGDRMDRINRGEVLDVTPVPKRSEQMGIDPNAGPLSSAAAEAVDTGAHDHMVQQAALQQAAEEAEKGGKGKKAETVDADTGEITTQGDLLAQDPATELQGRLDFVRQTARANGWDNRLIAERDRIQGELAKLQPQPAPAAEQQAAPTNLQEGIQQAQANADAQQAQVDAAQAPADIKAVIAKTIPQMSDAELQQAIAHYGPENKRTAKLQKEVAKRGAAPQPVESVNEAQQPAEAQPAPEAAQVAPQSQSVPAAPDTQDHPALGNWLTNRLADFKKRNRIPEGADIEQTIASNEGSPNVIRSNRAAKLRTELRDIEKSRDAARQWLADNPDQAAELEADARLDFADPVSTLNFRKTGQRPRSLVDDAQQSAAVTDRPLADKGLNSFRYQGRYGPIMIGAKDADEALREAARSSTDAPVREKLEAWDGSKYVPVDQPGPGAASVEGRDLGGGWAEFHKDSGTVGIPRAEMPQIKAEHRGAMVNFLNARGVQHQEETVPADSLKPTQAEFSRDKVARAKDFDGGNRSILISQDGHVLDGHHQWKAARDNGEDVKVIRLDSPIRDLVKLAHEFPSSTTDSASGVPQPGADGRIFGMRPEQLGSKQGGKMDASGQWYDPEAKAKRDREEVEDRRKLVEKQRAENQERLDDALTDPRIKALADAGVNPAHILNANRELREGDDSLLKDLARINNVDLPQVAESAAAAEPAKPSRAEQRASAEAEVIAQLEAAWSEQAGDGFTIGKLYPATIRMNGKERKLAMFKKKGGGTLYATALDTTIYGPSFTTYKVADGKLVEDGSRNLFAHTDESREQQIAEFNALFEEKPAPAPQPTPEPPKNEPRGVLAKKAAAEAKQMTFDLPEFGRDAVKVLKRITKGDADIAAIGDDGSRTGTRVTLAIRTGASSIYRGAMMKNRDTGQWVFDQFTSNEPLNDADREAADKVRSLAAILNSGTFLPAVKDKPAAAKKPRGVLAKKAEADEKRAKPDALNDDLSEYMLESWRNARVTGSHSGWSMVDDTLNDNGNVRLVSQHNPKLAIFKYEQSSGTDHMRARIRAIAWAEDNPETSAPATGELVVQPLFGGKTKDVAAKKEAPKKARGVLAKKAEAEAQARADYFKPGNIVRSYGGTDRVVSYTPPNADGQWSVTVRAVRKDGDTWVDTANETERTHSTAPDARDLKAGPLDHVEPPKAEAGAFPLKEAQASYSGISHSGTSRGKADADEYQTYIDVARDAGMTVATTDAQRDAVEQATESLREDYLAQYRKLMSVRAGTYSGFVAGRSGLNSKQADKRNSAYDRAIDSFTAWQKANQDSVRKAALDARTDDQKVADTAAVTQAREDKEQRKQDADRKLMRKILSWKKGGEPVTIGKSAELAGVSMGRDGYPTSIKLKATDGSVLTDDKFDLAKLFRETGMSVPASKARVRELVDAVRTEDAQAPQEAAPAPAPAAAPAAAESKTPVLDQHVEVMGRVRNGTATTDEYKQSFADVDAKEEAIRAELSTMTKDALLRSGGAYFYQRYNNEKKAVIVDALVNRVADEYALGRRYGSSSYVMSAAGLAAHRKVQDEALRELVANTTQEDLAAYAQEVAAARAETAARRDATQKALSDPQTLSDFRSVLRNHIDRDGDTYQQAYLRLTPEQRQRYDNMEAENTKLAREQRKAAQRSSVATAGQATTGEVIATKHTKHGHDLYVVQLGERVSREDYDTLNSSAKRMGGSYSSYRGNGAVPGFQFRTREAADAFSKLVAGDATDAQAVAQERRSAFDDDRSQSAVERLRTMADALNERADEALNRDRKTNTERRARMANSAEASARADKALAGTMTNLAAAIESGDAKFLDTVRQKVQVEFLARELRNAKDAQIRAKYPSYGDQQNHQGEPVDAETVDYADFPRYTAMRSDLAGIARQMLDVDGTKKLGARLLKVADDVSDAYTDWAKGNLLQVSRFSRGDGVMANFASRDDAERAIRRANLADKAIVLPIKRGENRIILSPSESMKLGLWNGDGDKRITLASDFGRELVEAVGRRANGKIAMPWQLESAHEKRKRLEGMGITTGNEYRAALREFAGLREAPAEADKIKQMERAMIGRRADGLDFFPTSSAVTEEAIEAADIREGMDVLEPSAGMGHIADAIREQAGVEPDVVEMSGERRELLQAKGYELVGSDFMELSGKQYDRIVMNPPFSKGRDIQHVRHAYSLLKPGGRIVAIMGEGAFFQSNSQAENFRLWMEDIGATSEKLPEGSFMDPSLPVNTGVNARMVIIDKPTSDEASTGKGPDVQFSFAGRNAQGADTYSLNTAQQRLALGDNPEAVRQETGWHRGADGKWRYEISDHQATIKPGGVNAGSILANAQLDAILDDRKRVTAADVLDHPELFAAYPSLATVTVEPMPEGITAQARLLPRVTGATVQLQSSMPRNKVASALLHELQHGIQIAEGFAMGGSKKALASDLDPTGADTYRRLAGEVEARNTQTRLNMTPRLRREISPEESADVPADQVLVTFNGKQIELAPSNTGTSRMPLTSDALVRSFKTQFPGLAPAVSKLLARGKSGQRGGVVLIDSADPLKIAGTFARKTGTPISEAVQLFTDGGTIQGFYDAKSGLTFLVGPNLDVVTGPAVLLHEMTHGQQREKIDAHAMSMLAGRSSVKNDTLRGFLDRVAARMVGAGEAANAREATAYIVEQAVLEGRTQGFADADNRFLGWVDENIGKRVGDLLRSFLTMARQWMLRNGVGLNSIGVDDLVQYAMAGVERAAQGDVQQAGVDGPAFSRASMRDLAGHARRELDKTFSAPGTLSKWHTTVGTMYNLAERNPLFKPVFEAAQGFIDDVSHYANDAAEKAGRLLPKLETWRDITKSPLSAEDNKAVARPIFEGTLMWTRDLDGSPVRVDSLAERAQKLSADQKAEILVQQGKLPDGMLRAWKALPADKFAKMIDSRYETQMLKAGIVWTDAELQGMFKLSPEQVGLYHEFREATNRSMDTMARAQMLRLGGDDVKPLRDQVMDAADAQEAARMLRDYLAMLATESPDRADNLMATANNIMADAESLAERQAEGYAPLSRFGKYTVYVQGANDESLYFGMFESKREANQMAETMRELYPTDTVTQGTKGEQIFSMFAGVSPETAELFGKMMDFDTQGSDAKDQAFQEWLRLTKNNRSAMKRLIHRKGIAGYSEDVGRVLASFIYSNARNTAAGLNMGDLNEAVTAIPKEQGELQDVATELADYIKNPQEEGQAVRGLLFAQYLGGSIASAFVNMTQPVAVTFPWLSQFGGARRASAELATAAKQMAKKGHQYEADLQQALHDAEEDGTVSPQEVHQLMAQARGSGSLRAGDGTRAGNARAAAQNSLSRLSVAWGKLFGAAEQINRRMTFIAAYRMAKQQGMADPAAFARRAVKETQFVYSKASKMKWGRGAVGGTLMTFKTYSIAYLELMGRLWSQGAEGSQERKDGRKAVLLMLGTMVLLSGAGGLPFSDDIEDVIDGIAQLAGYNLSTQKLKQEFLEDVFGKDIGSFIDKGITALPGMPLDVSGRLGMGNVIPGTGLLQKKTDHTRDVLEIAGPAGDMAARFATGTRKLLGGDVGGVMDFMPTAVRNAAKGIDMAANDMYRDDKGYKVLETSPLEAALKGIGFQPASVATIQEANYLNQRSKAFYNYRAQEIRAMWAQGVFEKNPAKVQEARDAVADWNAKNPDQRMTISVPDVMRRVREMSKSKDQRIADTAPKAMRHQMKLDLAAVRADMAD